MFTLLLIFVHLVYIVSTLQEATLPQNHVDTTYDAPTGQILEVCHGGCQFLTIQSAIDAAVPGDTISIASGEIFEETLSFPEKVGAGDGNWVYLRPSEPGLLPSPSERVGKGCSDDTCIRNAVDKMKLPIIEHTNPWQGNNLLFFQNMASYYRIVGLEIRPKEPYEGSVCLCQLGENGLTDTADYPHHVIIDRCYIHGINKGLVRTAVSLQGESMAVIDSYISDFRNREAQPIWGFNGPGPYKIHNNFIEGSGENIMFGGTVIRMPNNLPSDVTITNNHLFKRLDWKNSPSSYPNMDIKNLLEFKVIRRVLIEGNIFENCWKHTMGNTQKGHAILISPRCEGGAMDWIVCDDITIRNNLFKSLGFGVSITSADFGNYPEQQVPTRRVTMRNNLFYDLFFDWGEQYMPGGLLITRATRDVIIDHNTMILADADNSALFLEGQTDPYLNTYSLTNNLFTGYFWGQGCRGDTCVDNWAESPQASDYGKNIWVDGNSGAYSTWFGSDYVLETYDLASYGFKDAGNDDYELSSTSIYKNEATDGTDIGADITELMKRIEDNQVSGEGVRKDLMFFVLMLSILLYFL